MIYISDNDVKNASLDWVNNVDIIESSVKCLANNEYAQPVKPYLRYRDLKNRIIAMPAFVGGDINMSGIKWISSFPGNLAKGIPRAHCIVVLNDTDTGEPICILNSGRISAIRTAAVSGFVISKYLQQKESRAFTVGIVGFGPIGQYHLSMCSSILNGRYSKILLYDIKGIDLSSVPDTIREKVIILKSWEEVYDQSDIFITCTVSTERYIDRKPKANSLHLNVSLRDYKSEVYDWFKDAMIVDDWNEVCRENTDVERFHLDRGLSSENVKTIQDLLTPDWINSRPNDQAIMFNPMGMAIFDIAISQHYMRRMTEDHLVKVLN